MNVNSFLNAISEIILNFGSPLRLVDTVDGPESVGLTVDSGSRGSLVPCYIYYDSACYSTTTWHSGRRRWIVDLAVGSSIPCRQNCGT